MKISDWIVIDGYCATRVLFGTDHNDVKNRVAFIEKTPCIRVSPFTDTDDYKNWVQGEKGTGGCCGENHEELGQYGFDPESREWCDSELRKIGYKF